MSFWFVIYMGLGLRHGFPYSAREQLAGPRCLRMRCVDTTLCQRPSLENRSLNSSPLEILCPRTEHRHGFECDLHFALHQKPHRTCGRLPSGLLRPFASALALQCYTPKRTRRTAGTRSCITKGPCMCPRETERARSRNKETCVSVCHRGFPN